MASKQDEEKGPQKEGALRTSLYSQLGVSETADTETIKKAYHELAKKLHPDKQGLKDGKTPAADLEGIDFTVIQEAYTTLIDPIKKKEYDLILSETKWEKRPGSEGEQPTRVNVKISFNSWHIRIIDGHEHFEADLNLDIYWRDPRLTNWGKKAVPKNIWKPEFISNPVEADPSRSEEVPTIADRNADDGWLMYQLPMKKFNVNLNEDFHRLMNFPYDSLRIDAFVCLSGELRLENSKDIVLQLENKNKHGQISNIFMGAARERSEFILEGLSYGLAEHSSPNIKDQVYHDVVFSFHLTRDPTFYFWKAQVPTIAIVIVSMLTYIYDPGDLGDKMETVMAMFLTSFAIQWTVMERLPPTPYLHNVDLSLNAALFSMFSIAVSHCISFRISKFDEDYANTFDLISFIALFIAYIGSQVFIYLRIHRLKKLNGNRPWSEGKKFMNKMCKLRKGALFFRSTAVEGSGFQNNPNALVGLARSPEDF